LVIGKSLNGDTDKLLNVLFDNVHHLHHQLRCLNTTSAI